MKWHTYGSECLRISVSPAKREREREREREGKRERDKRESYTGVVYIA